MSKKATIVPGVHDLIPPDGRVTVELLHPDTGRVRHKVRAENALMDWFRKNVVPNGGRGEGTTQSVYGWDAFNPMLNLSVLSKGWAYYVDRPYAWPSPTPPNLVANWLWATDQNVTPDQTQFHIPTGNTSGDVTSGTKLDAAWSPDGVMTKRGSLQMGSVLRTWDRNRLVTEFGLSYGNGTYRSIGLGSLINQRNGAGMRATPSSIQSALLGNTATGTFAPNNMYNPQTGNGVRGCVDYEDGGFWLASSTNGNGGMTRLPRDYASGSWPAVLVSLANHPGSGGQVSYAVNGSDFWVSRNQALYRCVKPVSNVAMTVTNTYNLSATLGAQTILDMAIDRVGNRVFLLTSSHVHVINGVDGTPISNFAHGMTSSNAAGIGWSPAENQLYVNFYVETYGGDEGWGSAVGANPIPTAASAVVRGFTTAGAAAKSIMLPQYGTSTGSQPYSAYFGLNDWGIAHSWRNNASTWHVLWGPSMASHALLPSDVVKTSADALRITYDFDFV